METNPDVELESENSLTSSPRPLRKNITIKLKSDKGSGSSRGRPRKSKSKKEDQEPHSTEDEVLDTPIFKTMEPGEPLHHNKKLRWDHKVTLIGEKVVDPLIHCCEKCSLPILIYGRMIQCKHVFCFTCAKKTEKTCPRCGDPVQRIEQSALGTVFLCTYGTSKHGTDGCRRTYLSQRDLNAHIGHRHLKAEMADGPKSAAAVTARAAGAAAMAQAKATVPQLQTQALPSSQASHQALLEQFTAVVRQATASVAGLPPQQQRGGGPEEQGYQPGQTGPAHSGQPGHLQQQHQAALASAHPAQGGHMLQQQAPPHSYPPGSVMPSHPSLVVSQSMASQAMAAASSHENFTSSIPVVGSRIKTIISVPIQEDDFGKQPQQQQQPQQYHSHQPGSSMQPINYMPPSMSQYPGSMAPNMHQLPPGVPPPMFSSQSVPPGPMQNPIYTAPMTQPQLRGPPQQMPPRGPSPGPPRIGGPGPPPTGPPPRFYEGQNPRGPWTGPPGGPPSGPPRPRGPPQADYNYY